MTMRILNPGPQASIQGRPRRGYRHLGVPWSGPADALSLALANRLVGNGRETAGIEITLGGFEAELPRGGVLALCGAGAHVTLGGQPVEMHRTLMASPGERLSVGIAKEGMRIYLAVAGGFLGEEVMGSPSTYMPAELGGIEGRALAEGDEIGFGPADGEAPILQTPEELRPRHGSSTVLRVVHSAEFEGLSPEAQRGLFETPFTAAAQVDRMGIRLEGRRIAVKEGAEDMRSGPVFPGIVQCPPGGEPILLGADAQTTGGYPRALSVITCDLPLIGQVRPRSRVQFFYRSRKEAIADTRGKAALYATWLGH